MEKIIKAIRRNDTVRMEYYALGKDEFTKREGDPYVIRCVRAEWYLVEHDYLTRYEPLFHISRITKIEQTGAAI